MWNTWSITMAIATALTVKPTAKGKIIPTMENRTSRKKDRTGTPAITTASIVRTPAPREGRGWKGNGEPMWKYIKNYFWLALIAGLFMIGEVAMDLVQPGIMSRIVDDGVLGLGTGGAGDLSLIWVLDWAGVVWRVLRLDE